MGIEPTSELGKLILKRENARIGELAAFKRFLVFLKWIPIGAAMISACPCLRRSGKEH